MLTPDQLTAIDRHLRKENWLLNEDLILELTDHYINGISERITQGMAFDVALREIYRNFGGRPGLLKMEEEKGKIHSSVIGRELRRLIGSYFLPPRLSLTLSLLGFAYWATIEGLVGEWLGWASVSFMVISTMPLIILFLRNGYSYVAGKRESMQSVKVIFYRYILAVNLLNILNFCGGSYAMSNITDYSTTYQTFITFAYLFVWAIIIDFVLVQPYRFKTYTA